MTINDVHEHYGENWAHAMRCLGMCRMSYRYWIKIGYVPRQSQYKIEKLSKGKLKVSSKEYDCRPKPTKVIKNVD